MKYAVPVSCFTVGYVAIEAESPEQALKIATDNLDNLPIPNHACYTHKYISVGKKTGIVGENEFERVKPEPYTPNML